MSNARLISVEVERFKSYEAATRIDLAPLTVILGRNNSGKSTLIQALLLLKQTLAHPRADVPLHLEGPVDALTLRELTSFGWTKKEGERLQGPRICLRWRSVVDVSGALERARHPNLENLVRFTRIEWLTTPPENKQIDTKLVLDLAEERGRPVIEHMLLVSTDEEGMTHGLDIKLVEGEWRCAWDGQNAEHIEVEFDHFIPHLELDRDSLGPRHWERALHNGYLVLFEQPLVDLEHLLRNFLYLGSTRTLPPALFKPSSVPPDDIGVSGEYAAQLIHSRRSDVVHYLPPLEFRDSGVMVSRHIRSQTFLEAINDILTELGVNAALRIEDIQNIGFRLLFGEVGLFHVGRGLTSLLAIIELCLFADPLRFEGVVGEHGSQGLELYQGMCRGYAHLALEEPESHLHPKVQSRLAQWMVALAMANRRIIIETHSDHFVRRLRGLMARAAPDSELEQWLRENVSIVEVEQDAEGRSHLHCSRLTPDGMLSEHWPADFMDEASGEERAIYYASLDKRSSDDMSSIEGIDHDPGPEPEPDSQP